MPMLVKRLFPTVSIHASRCREAMRSEWPRKAGTAKFQSTPPVAGRRCTLTRNWAGRSRCFNPRLPLPGGDALDRRGQAQNFGCFNPRLPLPGGDAPDRRAC